MIEASELIITPKGRIYHLDLFPGEIGDTIITVGDPARVKQVSDHFSHIELKREHREFITHTGIYNNKRLSVVSTGIGTDNIDIVITELDALVNIEFSSREIKPKPTLLNIIRLGTCGSLQGDIEVDSFVANESAIGLDNLMFYYNIENDHPALLHSFNEQVFPNSPVNTYHFNADDSLLKQFGAEIHQGITTTCPGFYGPQGRMLRAPLRFNDLTDRLTAFHYKQGEKNYRITNFEMETSGIYGMARLLGHKALSLNAIIANRVTKQFSNNLEAATAKLIEHFFNCLE